jgi:signal transduction histidine kinase
MTLAVPPARWQRRPSPTRWLRLPRWTVRLRLGLLYGVLSIISGAGVFAITYWLVDRFLANESPARALGLVGLDTGPGTVSHPGATIINTPNGDKVIVMSPQGVAALTAHQHASELHQLLLRSGIALAIMTVVSVALGWLVAGRALHPLRAMVTSTQQISEENLQLRLAWKGPRDELKELGDTFDMLLARLENAFEAQRSFVANASHELRTPLTLARALLQMCLRDPGVSLDSYRKTCEEVLATTQEQEELIESLLTLARSQRGIEQRARFDLADVAHEVIESRKAVAAERAISIGTTLAQAPTSGDASLVERLVSNLVDNAVRHNVPAGNVHVSVEPWKGQAVLWVANTGPVIPAGDINRLLQPFQRFGNERGTAYDGLGLGLSIVAAVAKAHGAVLEVRSRSGGGLAVEVRFPPLPD